VWGAWGGTARRDPRRGMGRGDGGTGRGTAGGTGTGGRRDGTKAGGAGRGTAGRGGGDGGRDGGTGGRDGSWRGWAPVTVGPRNFARGIPPGNTGPLIPGKGADLDTEVHGHCDQRFSRVAAVFARHFERGEEAGAAVCVYQGDDIVVDLWAGHADPRAGRPWERDTPCLAFRVPRRSPRCPRCAWLRRVRVTWMALSQRGGPGSRLRARRIRPGQRGRCRYPGGTAGQRGLCERRLTGQEPVSGQDQWKPTTAFSSDLR
jgi:hypothetical protein